MKEEDKRENQGIKGKEGVGWQGKQRRKAFPKDGICGLPPITVEGGDSSIFAFESRYLKKEG